MAAPVASAKPTSPTGFKMPDGYQSIISFKTGVGVGIQLWIQVAKFGGRDGGEKINTSTMYNTKWRTFAARKLKTKEDTTFKAAFDPDAMPSLDLLINDDTQVITEFYPDGSNECYYGYLMKWGPPEFKEGEFPVADFTIVCTNWDKANQVEAGPVFTPAGGT